MEAIAFSLPLEMNLVIPHRKRGKDSFKKQKNPTVWACAHHCKDLFVLGENMLSHASIPPPPKNRRARCQKAPVDWGRVIRRVRALGKTGVSVACLMCGAG